VLVSSRIDSVTTEANYALGIRSVVGKQLFNSTIKFITSKNQGVFGSQWQKKVSAKVGVLEHHKELSVHWCPTGDMIGDFITNIQKMKFDTRR
jgi:hypothetical protein